jgi:hypothetical protein
MSALATVTPLLSRFVHIASTAPTVLGQPLTVRPVVHRCLGSITLNWPVTGQK